MTFLANFSGCHYQVWMRRRPALSNEESLSRVRSGRLLGAKPRQLLSSLFSVCDFRSQLAPPPRLFRPKRLSDRLPTTKTWDYVLSLAHPSKRQSPPECAVLSGHWAVACRPGMLEAGTKTMSAEAGNSQPLVFCYPRDLTFVSSQRTMQCGPLLIER